jgi:hypothetical protein
MSSGVDGICECRFPSLEASLLRTSPSPQALRLFCAAYLVVSICRCFGGKAGYSVYLRLFIVVVVMLSLQL